jgi:uncharacterized protein (TIGR03435 family)
MRRAILGVCVAAAAICGAMAQSADEQMTFEVASIKPAEPMQPGHMMMGSRGGPGSADPGHLTYNNLSLKNMLVNAFGVKGYQISGPAWLDSERFDMVAKVPQGATKEQVRVMMQNLLKERFHLVVHHETKELPMYAMVVGKSGPKMKESPEDPPPSATGGPSDSAPKPPDGPPALGKISVSPDGTIKLPPGFGPKEGCMMMMMMSPAGPKSHMQCSKQTMAKLAEQLSNQMDRPVNDMTGLSARYDFNLDFLPDESRMGPMMLPPGGASASFSHDGPGPGPMAKGDGPEQVNLAPLPAALQEQLGLKLEQKKGPVDLIVIDKIDKAPTEN